jgi:DNA-binding transcriptional ArsR family regulator
MTIPTLDEMELLHSHICQAVSDPKRLLILYTLQDRPRHVTALAEDLGMPQPTVSRHLRVLRQRMLVTTEREGTAVIYRLADEDIITILEAMRRLLRSALARQSEPLLLS